MDFDKLIENSGYFSSISDDELCFDSDLLLAEQIEVPSFLDSRKFWENWWDSVEQHVYYLKTSEYENLEIETSKILHIQLSIEYENLQKILGYIETKTYKTDDLPELTKISENLYVVGNGNHRVTAHRLLGKSVLAHVYEDQELSRFLQAFLTTT